ERGVTMRRDVDWTRGPERPRPMPTVLLALSGLVYFGLLIFTSVLAPYRFPIPYAVPIFDTPFVLAAIGVGYLCWERHRLRQDLRSASLGGALWGHPQQTGQPERAPQRRGAERLPESMALPAEIHHDDGRQDEGCNEDGHGRRKQKELRREQ